MPPTTPARREELLTFVVVGGGYAGLEALAEVQDFAADAIEQYPSARLHGMRWMLVEAMDRVLPEIDVSLADYAIRELRGRGIDVRLGTTLEEVTATSVRLTTGEVLPTRTVVWTAGVTAHPSVRNLGLPTDVKGRIVVDRYLRAPSEDNVWALGDCAAVPDPRKDVEFCPPTSQHAVRQGGPRAATWPRRSAWASQAFNYKSMGQFANLGRYKAVAKVFRFQIRGFPAWWLARTYHLSQIPGTARKVRAVVDWTVGLPFRRDIAEVGTIGQPRPCAPTCTNAPARTAPSGRRLLRARLGPRRLAGGLGGAGAARCGAVPRDGRAPARLGARTGAVAGAWLGLERLRQHLLDAFHPDELDVLQQVLREVLDVGLVQLRRDHALEPGVLRGERLLLEPADRQHLAREGQLARHRGVLAHLPARDQRRERGRHRDARGGPVLRDRSGRDVDVQVMRLEIVGGQILLEPRGVRAHE